MRERMIWNLLCESFNPFGSQESLRAFLSLGGAPVFTTQPQDVAKPVGEQGGLNADVNGTQPMTYQWYKGNEELPNETNSTLTLTNLQLTDAGQYLLKASNAYGVKDSRTATVSVGYTPTIAKDLEDITTTVGSRVLMSVEANGTAPFTYDGPRILW